MSAFSPFVMPRLLPRSHTNCSSLPCFVLKQISCPPVVTCLPRPLLNSHHNPGVSRVFLAENTECPTHSSALFPKHQRLLFSSFAGSYYSSTQDSVVSASNSSTGRPMHPPAFSFHFFRLCITCMFTLAALQLYFILCRCHHSPFCLFFCACRSVWGFIGVDMCVCLFLGSVVACVLRICVFCHQCVHAAADDSVADMRMSHPPLISGAGSLSDSPVAIQADIFIDLGHVGE